MDQLAGWAEAAREGDPVAIAALVRSTQSEVWRLCAYLVDRQHADDLAQETYLRAFRALPSYAHKAPFRVWLLGIARRTCVDHLRRRLRRRRLFDRLVMEVADESVAATDVGSAHLLSGLDVERRTAFVLTQLLGYSYADAASVCEVPLGTIRSRVAHARTDLQAAIKEDTA